MRNVIFKTNRDGDYEVKGKFHQWALDLAETGSEIANFTMALIELENGEIRMVNPNFVKFLD